MDKKRLPRFEDAIVRSDARWFRDQAFINDDIYQRVLAWLEGTEDKDIQEMVAAWMALDADWVYRVEPAAMSYFWYVAPAVKLQTYLIRKMLLGRVKRLRAGTTGSSPAESGVSPS
jgi:hypothetical protein